MRTLILRTAISCRLREVLHEPACHRVSCRTGASCEGQVTGAASANLNAEPLQPEKSLFSDRGPDFVLDNL